MADRGRFGTLLGNLDLDAGLRDDELVTDSVGYCWLVTGKRLISTTITIDDTLNFLTPDSGSARMLTVNVADSLVPISAYLRLDSVVITGSPTNSVNIGVGTSPASAGDLIAVTDKDIVEASTAATYVTGYTTSPSEYGLKILDIAQRITSGDIYLNWGTTDPQDGRVRIRARLILVCESRRLGGL